MARRNLSEVSNRTPILVATGQTVVRDAETEAFFQPPVDLAATACRQALTAARLDQALERVDTLAMVRLFTDSFEFFQSPFGGANNPPASVAHRLGIKPRECIYSQAGGNTPQQLVNEMAGRIARGETRVALITGAEAIAAQKLAARQGRQLDWEEQLDSELDDRGVGDDLVADWEMAHGVGLPVYTYPIIEHAIRYQKGHSREQHQRLFCELFAGFSQVASDNPYAQFPLRRTVDELLSTADGNYPIADPYQKYLVAQDGVNQAAAVVMMSVAMAKELAIPEQQWVYLHGAAEASDHVLSKRENLATSAALEYVAEQTLAMAELEADAIRYYDIYSCFPCAVTATADELQLISAACRRLNPHRRLTLFWRRR